MTLFVPDNILKCQVCLSQGLLLGECSHSDLRKKLSDLEKVNELRDKVIERARYLVWPLKNESPSEVCPECGTYGVGELRDAFKDLKDFEQGK